jgi:hypothetical protein
VCGDHGRHEAYVPGQRGDAGGDEHGVEAPADLVGAGVGFREVRGLGPESVLDRHEVEQPALGLLDEVGPVAGGEQLTGPRHLLAPGGRVPACAVKGNGEVQCGG